MSATALSISESRTAFDRLALYPKLALAVSGGPDSLALLHLAATWRAARGKGPELHVLTVDHGLRAASREEALMVGRLASALGLPHAILEWEQQGERYTALQARARAARYDLMVAYCHAHDIPALATAHTLDDQAETFLMRLKRGSGLDGLAAIPMTGAWSGIAVERPLLDVAKARLIATLQERGIGFVSDPSNSDVRFERARVRREAGALAALGLTAEALALSARRLRRAREALDQAAESFLAASSEVSEAGYATVDREALLAAPQEIALRALSRLIAMVGGGEEPLRLAKVETLLASLASCPGKTHTLGRCRIGTLGQRLGIFREMRAKGLPMIALHPGMRVLWDNRFRMELGTEEREPVTVKALGEQGLRDLRDRFHLLATLPPLASRTLPACFRGAALIGLPALGSLSGFAQGPALTCRASFIGAESHVKGGTAMP
ncbi:MAG: tRNA lysidine(34) synthetase TilS [Methyloceanibacter sp.]